jgi:hypothetical protein
VAGEEDGGGAGQRWQEGHQGWALLRVVFLSLCHQGSHIYIVSVFLGIPKFQQF